MTIQSRPVCFEDVAVGDEIPPLDKGPFTTAHIMRWSAAMENWHKIHYDRDFAVNHDKLPGLLVNGSLKQQFYFEHLRKWIGDTGWVWKVTFRFRAMNLIGEKLTMWGRVTGKRECPDYGIVELDLGIVNEEGTESSPGTGTVALPYRGGDPVPYPFVPPA
ncbi:MAG: hypothetical protein RLO50_20025 [Azospirillaceae bacterium]